MAASLKADESLRAAVAEAEDNIASFAKKSKRKAWSGKIPTDATVGEKFDPFQRVGVYIPGGTAPLVSTAPMTIKVLHKVAGCIRNRRDDALRQRRFHQSGDSFVMCAAGATIYRVGGAQAIAALAYGTKTIPRAGTLAPATPTSVGYNRLLVGRVAIDLLAGGRERQI